MEASTRDTNGKSEKIGELRGEIRSLIREVQETRVEQIRQYTACQTCQRQTQDQLGQLGSQMSNHITAHKMIEAERTVKIVGKRWTIERGLTVIALALTFGVSVAALAHNW